MTESLSGLFAGLIFVTVAMTAFSIGLLTTWNALRATVRRRVFLFVLLVNVFAIPLFGWLVVTALDLGTDMATGVLLCAICAAGPVALKASQIARNDLDWALSLTVILLAVNVVSLPLWSAATIDRALVLRPSDLVGVLLLAILVPVVVGVLVGRRSSDPQRASRVATGASNITLVTAIGVGIVGSFDDLIASFTSPVLAVSTVIIIAAGFAGWSVPDSPARRRASSLATLNRATSVALLVVGRVFPEQTEIFTTVVVFGLVQTVVALGVSGYWRWIALPRSLPARPHALPRS